MGQPRFVRFFRHLNWRTFKKTITRTIERRLLGLASEIAFNAMLSLFPAILAVVTAIGLFEASLQDTFKQLANELSQVVPEEALKLIRDFATKEITNSKNRGLFSLSFAIRDLDCFRGNKYRHDSLRPNSSNSPRTNAPLLASQTRLSRINNRYYLAVNVGFFFGIYQRFTIGNGGE